MKTHVKILAVLVVLLALILAIEAAGFYLTKCVFVKVNGVRYSRSTEYLDLRGQDISKEDYKTLREAIPGAVIHWDIPFQGQRYDDETTSIQLDTLTYEEVHELDMLKNLQEIDGENCRDIGPLLELRQRRPECNVKLSVFLGDMKLNEDTESLLLNPGETTLEALTEALPYLKNLQKIHFEDPDIPGMELRKLRNQFPNLSITWNKPVMGVNYSEDIEEINLSNTSPESLEQVEALMAYYPGLSKLIMENCGFTNDEMAAFRDRVRDYYQVVWGVQVGQAYVMTDQQGFIPSNENKRVTNEDANMLKYCEGLIAVDFGHTGVHNLSWVSGTPHLKYLIVGDGTIKDEDVAHLSVLQELSYLELFRAGPFTDISPLLECKALVDLNLSETNINVGPLADMTWLEHLWLLNTHVKQADREYLEEHLPDTTIMMGNYSTCHGKGWRQMQSYYDMRDVLGMWYISE